jgi:nicotinate phosphoribosyltransferase
MRRCQGLEAAMAVARCSALVGFAATSNTAAARRFGLPAAGTMAHSYVEAFADERAAFRAFAEDFPDRATFLVDTYDTPAGVRAAMAVIEELRLGGPLGVRLDSGDLGTLSVQARRLLDAAGLPQVRIVASGGLDEFAIAELVASGAPIDAYGVGTKMGTSADAPYLDSAYKLVAYGSRPVMKLSPAKSYPPGAKQVMRGPAGDGDLVGLREEPAPAGRAPLLERVMAGGRRVGPPAGLAAARERFEADLAWLPERARALRQPEPVPVLTGCTIRSRPTLPGGPGQHLLDRTSNRRHRWPLEPGRPVPERRRPEHRLTREPAAEASGARAVRPLGILALRGKLE